MSKKIVTLIALSASLNALAQTDTITSVKNLDDVIVTANKVEQKQNTTGKVITVIGKDVLEKSTAKSVAQLLNEQAGIVVNGSYNNAGSVQTVFMRGSNAGRTLILLDGIPMNDPSSISTDFDLNMFSITDVEKIEICKGAQSTLYGSDAVAGVINIITVKKNISKPLNAKATVGYGSFNTLKANAQVYGKVGKLIYVTRFTSLNTNGFSSAYDSTGTKNFDNDAYNGTSLSASLQYAATNNLSFKTFVVSSKYKADVDAGGFADKTNYFIDNKTLNTGFGTNYKKDGLNIVANMQHSKTNRFYDDGYSALIVNNSTNHYRAYSNFAELYASFKLKKHFTFLVGNDVRFANMDGSYYFGGAFPFAGTYKDTSINQYSVYVSTIYTALNNALNIELGARLNKHSRYGQHSTFTFNPSYAFDSKTRVFASIASGFKSPSIYQLYDVYSGNKDLNAEKSVNYELGLQFATKTFGSKLVYFNRNIDNGIDYNYVSYQYFNFVKQKCDGIELEATVKPTSSLTINANATFLGTTETTQSRVTVKDTTYAYVLRRPKTVFNANIGLQATKKLFFSLSTRYVSKRLDVGGYKKADVELASYFLVNAYAEYVFNSHAKLFADAQNIGNKKFFDIRGYNAIPTMLNVGFSINW